MLRNVGSNWVVTIAAIAATYVLTPFVITTLGPEGYGTWTLITSMTGYISLLALGIPMACVRYLAQHVAEGDVRKMNETIGSCAGLYLLIGGVAVLVGGILMVLFGIYEIPAVFKMEAHLAFGLMVLQVSAGFIGFLPEGILFAHHDFVIRNLVRIAGVLLRFALTIGLLTFNASLVATGHRPGAVPRLRFHRLAAAHPSPLSRVTDQPRRFQSRRRSGGSFPSASSCWC